MSYNFTYPIFHGDTFELPIAITGSNGSALDLSTFAKAFSMETNNGTILVTGSTTGVVVGTTNQATGSITFTVPYSIMAGSFDEGSKYLFDVEIMSAGSHKETLFVGLLDVEAEVTT